MTPDFLSCLWQFSSGHKDCSLIPIAAYKDQPWKSSRARDLGKHPLQQGEARFRAKTVSKKILGRNSSWVQQKQKGNIHVPLAIEGKHIPRGRENSDPMSTLLTHGTASVELPQHTALQGVSHYRDDAGHDGNETMSFSPYT